MIVRVAKTFIILLLSLPLFARAADYCVDTGAELASALSGAAASDEDDVIRLESGAVTLPGAITINSIHGGLSVIGGYSANCVLIASLSSFSTVIAAPGTSLYLGLGDGDLSTLRLNFTGFTAVTFSDQSYGTAVVAGEIRVQRSAFVGNGTGLSIVTNHHDVRVENSLFVGSTLNDGNIYAGSGLALSASSISTADISVQVINNTASNNRHGFTMVSTKPSLVPVLGNFVTDEFADPA